MDRVSLPTSVGTPVGRNQGIHRDNGCFLVDSYESMEVKAASNEGVPWRSSVKATIGVRAGSSNDRLPDSLMANTRGLGVGPA
jgi:hypothetical protein